MTDILPVIAGLLENIAPVELSFYNGCMSLPVITLSLLDNSSAVILSGRDRYSRISVQIDVYAESEKAAQDIAGEVNDVLAQKGIKRSFCSLITDEYKPRVCMRYGFGLDEVTGRTVSY